jgi:O-antigen/teichoic acid export membrane protein
MNRLKLIKQYILALLQKSLVRDTIWMVLSQGVGVFIQVGYFILIARALDAASYGAFISVAAVATIIFPFVGLGSGNILIKNVSRVRELFGEHWGNALSISLGTGVLAILILLASSSFLFPANLSLLAITLLLAADLIGLRLLELASSAFVAVSQVKMAAQFKMLYNLSKLVAAITLITFFKNPGILTWSILYCISTILPAALSLLLIHRSVGKPTLALTKFKPEFIQGFLFSVDASAANINANLDKAMLANLAGLQVAGIYGAGYRFIDICYYIIFAVASATYTRFFQHGTAGIKGSFIFAKKLIPIALLYGVVTTTSLFLLAPIIVPLMLGKEYLDSIEVLRWMSPIHLMSSIQFLAADILTGAGFQGSRSAIQVTAAFLNFGLNFWLIPIFSWKGSACATLTSEALKTLGLWLVVAYFYRQQIAKSKIADK